MRRGFLLVLLLLGGCLPIPDLRYELELPEPDYRVSPERVRVDYVSLPGYPEPNTPEDLNRAIYLRYYLGAQPAETVLVLVPGLSAGAGSLDVLARQLVASHEDLEVWAVERRANLLEERALFLEALLTRDPMPAYRYYVAQAGTPDGFTPPSIEALPFLAHWGLELHLRDLHVIVEQARAQAERLVLGGHSLGASLASLYAAFDFGEPGWSDPGYELLDGLLLIDGGLGRTGAFSIENPSLSLGPFVLVPSIAEIEAGLGTPYLTLTRDPYQYVRMEAAALLARFMPDELSPGGFVPYPATNRAVAGIMVDDNYAISTAFSASVGRATQAEFGGNLPAVLISGAEGVRNQSIRGVAPGYDFVAWERGNPERERTDLEAVLQAFATPYSNFTEWYFPVRLLLDIAELDMRLIDTPGFVPNATVPTPTLAVGAGRGLVVSLDSFSAYMNVRAGSVFSAHILPGLTHYDVVMAERNPLTPLTLLWLDRLSGL